MTKNNAHLYLPLVQALAEGKTIQVKNLYNKFTDTSAPSFLDHPECYRIKPEPRELWLNEYPNDTRTLYKSPEDADKFAMVDRIARIHLREVID